MNYIQTFLVGHQTWSIHVSPIMYTKVNNYTFLFICEIILKFNIHRNAECRYVDDLITSKETANKTQGFRVEP